MSKLLQQAAVAVTAGVSTETPAPAVMSFYWQDEAKIIDNPYQYRLVYDPTKLLELAENIALLKDDLPTLGLEQLPYARLVRLVDGDYVPIAREELGTHEQIESTMKQDGVLAELMFGHRRRRAWTVVRYGTEEGCKRSGIGLTDDLRARYQALHGDEDYAVMPLHIGVADNEQMWKHAVSENRHRSDVSAIEEAEAMATAKSVFRYSDGQIGEIFGYARSTVANKQRLLKLPDAVRTMLLDGVLSERHGRELARLAEYPTEAIEAAKAVISGLMSPDMLERNVGHRLEVIEEKRKVQAQVAAAKIACLTWCLPGQSEPLGEVEISTSLNSWDIEVFSEASSTEMGLLQSGMCGKHCTCFCLIHKRQVEKGDLSPDPVNAPNVVVACASRQKRTNQEKRWQKQHAGTAELTVGERVEIEREQARQQVKAEKNQAGQQLIDQTLATFNLRSLWNSVEFWKLIAARNMPEQFSTKLGKARSINDVTLTYLHWYLDTTGRNWNRAAGESVFDEGELRKAFRLLKGAAGVSVETGDDQS